MAQTAENLTHRVYFDYVTGIEAGVSKQHTVMWRALESLPILDAVQGIQERFSDLLLAMENSTFRAGWGVTGVRYSVAGSTLSLPIDMITPLTTFIGQDSRTGWNPSTEAIQYRFEGRSPNTGIRGSFSLYGLYYVTVDSAFRLYPSEMDVLSDVLLVLTDPAGVRVVGRDNTILDWKRYVNVNYNSYWERNIRN